MNLSAAEVYIFELLRNQLPEHLYYHGLHHTQDVMQAAKCLAQGENISPEDTCLVVTAALFHDIGFVEQYFNNEPIGARYAREALPEFGYKPIQIQIITQLILATQIPQKPTTHLQKILCDADLDYLGREDFYKVARSLKKEWEFYKIIKTNEEWHTKQIAFLQRHHYFTYTAKKLRQARKEKHLKQLIKNNHTIYPEKV